MLAATMKPRQRLHLILGVLKPGWSFTVVLNWGKELSFYASVLPGHLMWTTPEKDYVAVDKSPFLQPSASSPPRAGGMSLSVLWGPRAVHYSVHQLPSEITLYSVAIPEMVHNKHEINVSITALFSPF